MSQDIKAIFSAKKQQAIDYYEKWSDLQKKVIQLLGNVESDESINVTKTDIALKGVIEQFADELDNPLITLATTGTTSGGKSSLVNLLCGAEIMPVAVQEMSAGTVIIDHHPTSRILKIPKIEGLPDDYSGEWKDLPDLEIRSKLQKVMDGYRQLRDENREPPAPRIEVKYPTRLGMRPEAKGLLHGFRLRIIDLPGFKYVADDHNKKIIRDEIKPALCLVTYNSEESDPVKQKILLDEVIDKVRELRGSPARMLFILNRIDVFRRDENWEAQTEKFTQKITNIIRTSVAQALPEYQKQANELQTQPLSTLPATWAYMGLNSSAEVGIQAMTKIDERFGCFIHREIIKKLKLHRLVEDWSDTQLKQVAEEVWHSSHGYDFDEKLLRHITDNIPQLLLPHLIKSVADEAGNALTTADQIIHAHIHATQERYQEECNCLNKVGDNLYILREDSKQELLKTVNFSERDDDIIEQLTDIATNLQQNYKLPKDSLVPLYDWSAQLGNAIEAFLSSVHKAIIEGNSAPQGQLIESFPPQEREQLSQMLKLLLESGYRNYADQGGKFDTSSQSEKDSLCNMKKALNQLSVVLAKNMKWVLERTSERESERIQDALQLLVEGYANLISLKALSVAPDLRGLAITPSKLIRIQQKLLLNFPLRADFPIHRYEKQEKVGEEQKKDGAEKVKVGEKRLWYTLWIVKEDVYETRDKFKKIDKYELRKYDAAVIPNITDIFGSFITQAKGSRHEAEFVRWLSNQLDKFLAGIEEYQENLLKEYRYHLDVAMKAAEDEKELNVAYWQPLADAVSNLHKEIRELLKVG